MDSTGTPDITGTDVGFQHYELLRREDGTPWELGRGTMGVTYKAFDVNLRCEVALKVVNPALLNHPQARERFVREARAAARLRHRNIASIYHLSNDGQRYFYAMEFIDGETLDALVRRQGPLTPDAALRVLHQASRALAAAARQGLIHRDIKPGNIMVVHEDDDEHRVVKLIDFGLARAFREQGSDTVGSLTSDGFVGTPQFASPEALDDQQLDERSDIYSLGVTAWFLLTGRAPFVGSLAAICDAHLGKPLPWERLPPSAPPQLRKLLAHMLEKTPDRRPQTAVDLRREIEACRDALPADPSRQMRAPGGSIPPPARTPTPRAAAIDAAMEPGPGMILKGRYELLDLAGAGNSGRVFQARDRAGQGGICAVKILPPERTSETADREILAEEIRLIQAAPHRNLIRFLAFDRLASRDLAFVVQEWLQGFHLVDLLAARGGALPLRETLCLLAQAAEAVDHAAIHHLERLDLALHQVHVHFPGPLWLEDETPIVRRDYLQSGLETWPQWTLKVNPLGAFHAGNESMTWSGDVTLLPAAAPALVRDTHLDAAGEPASQAYMRGTAQIVYELLGGQAVPRHGAGVRTDRYVSLQVLNEASNAVLQRALFEECGFETSRAFFEALAGAAGFRPGDLVAGALAPAEAPQRVHHAAASPIGFGPGAAIEPARAASTGRYGRGDRAVSSSGTKKPREVGGDSTRSRNSFFAQFDRLSRTGRRYRSWLPTAAVAALLLVALGVIVTVAITARHRPRRVASAPSAAKSPAASPRGTTSHAASHTTPATAQISTTPPPLETPSRPRDIPVRIESQPPGAEIRMGSRDLGAAPLEVSLSPGEHQLVARYRNWPEVRRTVHLTADRPAAVEQFHLQPPAPSPDAEASGSASARPHATATAARRDATRSPSPASSPSASPAATRAARSEPFLAPSRAPGSTPAAADQSPSVRRAQPLLEPFDPDGSLQAKPRRKPSEPPPLPEDDGGGD